MSRHRWLLLLALALLFAAPAIGTWLATVL
jgi:hypothetical protein